MGNSLSLAASVGAPVAIGSIIGMAIAPETQGAWYKKQLKKPSWNPPGWVFGPVWTALYAAMGVAAHRVWQAGGGPVPLGLYLAQLGLNFAWSPLFFKYKNLKAASLEITALLGAVVATTWQFFTVDRLAGQLLLPYIGWTSFASCLTWWIYAHNREEKGGKPAPGGSGRVGDAVHAAAAEATAQAATVFLAQGGEQQADAVPRHVAEATAARTGRKDE